MKLGVMRVTLAERSGISPMLRVHLFFPRCLNGNRLHTEVLTDFNGEDFPYETGAIVTPALFESDDEFLSLKPCRLCVEQAVAEQYQNAELPWK